MSARALPRADEVQTAVLGRRRGRRDRWGARRRWPFGPVATGISLGLHAVALVGIVWALAAPPKPDGIGAQIYAVLTPDLGELEECVPLEMPEDLPEIEALDLPTLAEEPELEPERCLEPLDELEIAPTPSALSLSIVSKRVAPPQVVEVLSAPPPPVVAVPVRTQQPAPPSRPRAVPVARPRGALPRGRLRPLVQPIRYPESARRAGIQGRVRVAMTIDPQGSVVHAEILASSGHAILDQAALASARRWRFAPPGTFRRAAQTFRFSLN